jgi:MFS family permease
LIAFPFAERIGRKRTMIIASSIFLLGGTLMTASRGSLDMIYGGRAVAGLGIGASSMVVPVYISETAPPSIRGRLVGIFEIASQGGGMLGFWINYACDRTINVETQTQWVVPLAIQLIPGVLLLLGVAWCPESPRFLAKNDNFEGAERILCKIRGLDASHGYIQHEMSEIRAQIEERSANRQSKKEQFMKLFQKGVRNRMAIGLALMFLQSFTGVSSLDQTCSHGY